MINPPMTTNELYAIADDIHKALTRPPIKNFKTTKEKQIEFMWHLYKEGFTTKEIGEIYYTTAHIIRNILDNKCKGKRTRGLKRFYDLP